MEERSQREQFMRFVGPDALPVHMVEGLQQSELAKLSNNRRPIDFFEPRNGEEFDAPTSFRDKADLDQLLRYAARHNTNDIHLGDQVPVKARVSGTLYTLTERNLTQDELRSMMTSIYDGSGAAVTAVLGGGRIDTAYECPPTDKQDRSRWRVNMTLRYANGGNGFRVVMRQISSDPPPLEKIKMPSDVVDAVMSLQRGLFLMTGPTGSGKSTSLSSLVAYRLASPAHSDHIVTIESPIEFVYDRCPRPYSEVTQHEVPRMMKTFNDGVVNALREDPDLILLGEMRDRETMLSGIEASLTGHGLLSTLHTNSVVATVDRILKAFSPSERPAIQADLIDNLHMIVSQLLAKTVDGGRIALRERLSIDGAIKERLRRANNLAEQLRKEMQSSGRLMVEEARDAFKDGAITRETLDWYEQMDRMEREAA
ncbi:type IV pilus twitching motility protein PilT [Pseudomonas aeruginosa]|uniref:type IV pilus twitching motility protein PilT n=2 Tax=Pseudomonas aeruginosa TaxID=287 RepID=UPI000996E93D|nr:ATPase, T2SS/T4P/T4SS family [Pseudomonas aeruginosa]ELT7041083.1 Flp pilus assembly complex ATPase component TadA [Pseudomonas aeruginosa]KAA5588831.1 hypothetical protein F3H14_26490 [Pseudomonas aeruginosa]MBG6418229.1 Flp pilus assembly complex ATPase component TadA [Pseudomonas aeruginosa]MBH8810444.1 Flp pilus assembly complex ATPase component TadA [Pseudomonas aeruginosa]MBH8829062.1 Flp pilus assembly complex ATPase component TadA [Pseudomonas aeruginosa]